MKPTQTAEEFLAKKNKKNVIVRDEKLPMFSQLHNPNKDIFIVPTQEGSDKEDQWNGSIGDATLEHVMNMAHRHAEMEHFFMVPDGNLFRIEQNVSWREHNEEPQKKKIIEGMAMSVGRQASQVKDPVTGKYKARVTTDQDKENLIAFLMDELREQRERVESEDAMDQSLVPFDQWEESPQMTKHIDIPSTPVPLYIYAGNCSQMFYDFFPEDHPDKKLVNQFLSMINSIDWDDFQEDQVMFFKSWLLNPDGKEGSARRQMKFKHYFAADRFAEMLDDIAAAGVKVEGQLDAKAKALQSLKPEDIVIKALQDIEADWAQFVYWDAQNALKTDPVIKDIVEFEKALTTKFQKGELVYRLIGQFGATIWKKYGSKGLNAYHWRRYNQLKLEFAPRVIVSKDGDTCDLNRNTVREMTPILGEETARWAFTARPFFSVEDLIESGKFGIDQLGYTDNNGALVMMFQALAKNARNVGDVRIVTREAQQIMQLQKNDPSMMSAEEWTQVWQAYRVAKEYATNAKMK